MSHPANDELTDQQIDLIEAPEWWDKQVASDLEEMLKNPPKVTWIEEDKEYQKYRNRKIINQDFTNNIVRPMNPHEKELI